MDTPGDPGGDDYNGSGEGGSQQPLGPIPGKGGARRKRTTYSKLQLEILLEAFENDSYPGITMREYLSSISNVAESRIQVWFQNRRARQPSASNTESQGMSKERAAENCSLSASVSGRRENKQPPSTERHQEAALVSPQNTHQEGQCIELTRGHHSTGNPFVGQQSCILFHMQGTLTDASGFETSEYSLNEIPDMAPGAILNAAHCHLEGSQQTEQTEYQCSPSNSKPTVPFTPKEIEQKGKPAGFVDSQYGVAYFAPPAIQQRVAPYNLQSIEQSRQTFQNHRSMQITSAYNIQAWQHRGDPTSLSQTQPGVLPYAFPQHQLQVSIFHDRRQRVPLFNLQEVQPVVSSAYQYQNWQAASLPTQDHQHVTDVLEGPSDITQKAYHFNLSDCLPRASGCNAQDMIQRVSQDSQQRASALIYENNAKSVPHLSSPDSLHGESNLGSQAALPRSPYLSPEACVRSMASGSLQSSLYSQPPQSPEGSLQTMTQESLQSMSLHCPQGSPQSLYCLSPEDNLPSSSHNWQQELPPLLIQDTLQSESNLALQHSPQGAFNLELQDSLHLATHFTPQDFPQDTLHAGIQNIHISEFPIVVENTLPSSSSANLQECQPVSISTPSTDWAHMIKSQSEWLVETADGVPPIQATGDIKLNDLLDEFLANWLE